MIFKDIQYLLKNPTGKISDLPERIRQEINKFKHLSVLKIRGEYYEANTEYLKTVQQIRQQMDKMEVVAEGVAFEVFDEFYGDMYNQLKNVFEKNVNGIKNAGGGELLKTWIRLSEFVVQAESIIPLKVFGRFWALSVNDFTIYLKQVRLDKASEVLQELYRLVEPYIPKLEEV